jgi:Response regulator containing a CheY-like receiver domain and an HTH DNA-binding domain
MNQARVIIADDHAFVLHGLVNLLADRFDVVAAVADGQQLVDAATRLHPDVVVTDISMPGMNGIEALGRLKDTGAKIVVLTLHADPDLAAALMTIGRLWIRGEAPGHQRARAGSRTRATR